MLISCHVGAMVRGSSLWCVQLKKAANAGASALDRITARVDTARRERCVCVYVCVCVCVSGFAAVWQLVVGSVAVWLCGSVPVCLCLR